MAADLYDELCRLAGLGRVPEAIERAEAALREADRGRFEPLFGLRFTPSPDSARVAIDEFVARCHRSFPVRAVYLEMNGFDINWDEWYFDFFAYRTFSDDPWADDWLARWDGDEYPPFCLTGMEAAQAAFEAYQINEEWEDPGVAAAEECARYLVIARFLEFVAAAMAAGPVRTPVPVLATAHDADMFGRWLPVGFEAAPLPTVGDDRES